MRGFAFIQMSGAGPDLTSGSEQLPLNAFTLLAHTANHVWGVYLLGGPVAQISAINALPTVIGVCTWAQLDNVMRAEALTKVNTWATNHGYPTAPVTWTNRRVLRELAERLNPNYDDTKINVQDSE